MGLKSLLLAATVVAVPGLAVAGSLPVPASSYDWTGFYVGAVAGGGLIDATGPGYYYGNYYDISGSEAGAVAGGTAGANLQFGAGVIGLEGDIMWSSLDVSEAGYYTGDYYVMHSDWDWLATVRARAGVAVDRALIYVTGGLAIVDRKNSFCYEDPCGSYDDGYYDAEDSGVQVGFAAGAGVEYAVSQHATVKLDYLYIGLPTAGASSEYLRDDDYEPFNFKSNSQLLRLGVNWKFGGR
jgi:outer membrane immunogenic protein